jgi:soluble lytic murein transglycosylase-like protein
LLDAAAARYGVPPALARAIAWTESRGEQTRMGTSGERGVMQLMAATAQSLGVDPSDLHQNIDGGVRYLSQQLKRFGLPGAVAAYNAGPRYGHYPEERWPRTTQQYVRLVLAREQIESAFLKGAAQRSDPFGEPDKEQPGRSSSPQSPSQPQSHGGAGDDDT